MIRKMVRNMRKGALAAGAVVAGAASAGAQAMSGTNAVNLLDDNINNAINVAWPIVITVVIGLAALSVFLKIGRKAGART